MIKNNTKQEKKEYDRKRYLEKKDHILKATKKYRKNNPQISRKAQRKYYWKNKEKVLDKKSKKEKTERRYENGFKAYYRNEL